MWWVCSKRDGFEGASNGTVPSVREPPLLVPKENENEAAPPNENCTPATWHHLFRARSASAAEWEQ